MDLLIDALSDVIVSVGERCELKPSNSEKKKPLVL